MNQTRERSPSGSKNFYNIAVIGGGGVGKSALTIQFVQHQFCDEYDPTIEDNYRKQVAVDNEVCLLEIMDTAGQEEYSALRDQYVRGGEGFLLVFSLTSHESFFEMEEHFQRILRVKDVENAANIPIVLVGSKSDMINDRQVTTKQIEEFTKKYNLKYVETSAKQRVNVDDAFFNLVRLIRNEEQKEMKQTKKSNKKSSKKHLKHVCPIL